VHICMVLEANLQMLQGGMEEGTFGKIVCSESDVSFLLIARVVSVLRRMRRVDHFYRLCHFHSILYRILICIRVISSLYVPLEE
jgi:hypothetical protein